MPEEVLIDLLGAFRGVDEVWGEVEDGFEILFAVDDFGGMVLGWLGEGVFELWWDGEELVLVEEELFFGELMGL